MGAQAPIFLSIFSLVLMAKFMTSFTNSIALVELLVVLAFAFTSIIEARKKGMDLIGVYTVSMIAAFVVALFVIY